MVTQKFGWTARGHIERMSRHRLRRRILEGQEPAAAETVA